MKCFSTKPSCFSILILSMQESFSSSSFGSLSHLSLTTQLLHQLFLLALVAVRAMPFALLRLFSILSAVTLSRVVVASGILPAVTVTIRFFVSFVSSLFGAHVPQRILLLQLPKNTNIVNNDHFPPESLILRTACACVPVWPSIAWPHFPWRTKATGHAASKYLLRLSSSWSFWGLRPGSPRSGTS
jgi:hypothetical protein